VSSNVTLRQHIPNRGSQRSRLAVLTTSPQLSRPLPGIPGQALSWRVQANHNRVNTIGEEAQPDAFRTAHRHKQRPPIHELDVVVVLRVVRHTLAGPFLDRVERIATRQATDGAETISRVEDQIAWIKHYAPH
jgi:hypothetical protein